jgi:membrane protein DedA with SNARE-associated domain/rhodanese-related sulfurtransferase
MALPTHILLVYGYLLLFAWVLVEQFGIPLPATPVLLAAGALSAEHELSFPLALLAGLVATLIADTAWFHAGRRYGHQVLRLMCKLSLEPTICVRRTQDSFGRRREITLMIAKFVPGLATLAPPVAGQNGMAYGRFLFFDAIGATAWLSALLAAGRFFGDLLKRDTSVLDWAGRFSGALLVLGILGFLVGRIVRRRMVIRNLVAARLEPVELKRRLDAGESIYIVDLRHPLELLPDPFTLPGALHVSPEALASRHNEIPRDRDIVLYCTCPSEATAAKTAMTLHKLGIERVRPLRGGYDEWKRLGFPLQAVPPVSPFAVLSPQVAAGK